MKEWIEHLIALQDIDMRIRRMQMRMKLLPNEKVKLTAERVDADAELKSKSEKSKKCELEIKQVESEISQLNDEISKLQSQSVMIKKNDEYRALLSEIGQRNEKISDCETKEIMLMDELEEDRSEFKEYHKQHHARTKAIEDEINELTAMESELKEEIIRQTRGRRGFESKLTVDVLNVYNRMLKSKGIPFVKIHNSNCGNCHLKLIPQTMAVANRGAVVTCENCSHMLYIDKR
ncbi:MAG: hypothetical protein L3J71_03000 [Victivallaceae bacterium]|nr:hypothetical protein [Victivallaceae bacterium]